MWCKSLNAFSSLCFPSVVNWFVLFTIQPKKKKKIFRGNTGPKDTKLRVSSKCALRCAFLFLWHYMFPISLFQIQNEYRQFQRRNNCQLLENMFTCYRYNRCIRKVDIFYKFCRTNEKNGRKIILFLFFKSK